MRVKFKSGIREATHVTHPEYFSKLLYITTSNGVYTVDFEYHTVAKNFYRKLLVDGWADITDYEYSN